MRSKPAFVVQVTLLLTHVAFCSQITISASNVTTKTLDKLVNIAYYLPASSTSKYVVDVESIDEDEDPLVHHVNLYWCQQIAVPSGEPYGGVACATGNPFDVEVDPSYHHPYPVDGGYLVCQFHFAEVVSAYTPQCNVTLASLLPEGARPLTQRVIDVSILALPPQAGEVLVQEMWTYHGPTVQLEKVAMHQHHFGLGGKVKVHSENGEQRSVMSTERSLDGEDSPPMCSTECGELRDGDQVTVQCFYDTTTQPNWVPYGMATGEMCQVWLSLFIGENQEGSQFQLEHLWDLKVLAGDAEDLSSLRDITEESLMEATRVLGKLCFE